VFFERGDFSEFFDNAGEHYLGSLLEKGNGSFGGDDERELAYINRDRLAVLDLIVNTREFMATAYLMRLIRRTRMHCLRKGLVYPCQ
jgi:hypothetical protein